MKNKTFVKRLLAFACAMAVSINVLFGVIDNAIPVQAVDNPQQLKTAEPELSDYTINPLFTDIGIEGLSEKELKLYEACVASLDDLQRTMRNPVAYKGDSYLADSAKIAEVLTPKEIDRTIKLVLANNPQYFWALNRYTYTLRPSYTVVDFMMSKECGENADYRTATKDAIYESIKECVKLASEENDDYKKALIIHDYLADNVSYVYDGNGKPSSEPWAHSVVGPLTDKKEAVCEGYAKAFLLLANACGLEATYCEGYCDSEISEDNRHAWNYVKIDGSWYLVDVTWDEASSNGGETSHDYFLQGVADMPHTREPSGDNQFWVPVASQTDYVYNGEEQEKYTVTYSSPTDEASILIYNDGMLVENGAVVAEGAVLEAVVESYCNTTISVNGEELDTKTFTVKGDTEVELNIKTAEIDHISIPDEKKLELSNISVELNGVLGLVEKKATIYTTSGGSLELDITWLNASSYKFSRLEHEFTLNGVIYLPETFGNLDQHALKFNLNCIVRWRASSFPAENSPR